MRAISIFKNMAATLALAMLTSCGGGGSCSNCQSVVPTPTPGVLSLTMKAPSQYPAGVAITAYLTMTNTSTVNGTNLTYTIPDSSNYIAVTITANPDGAGQSCSNIAAGATCTFTATIPAGSKPGSFTVVATPTSSVATKIKNILTPQADSSISVTANLGLVNTPNFTTPYYILPGSQTIEATASESTVAYVSLWIKTAETGLSSIELTDEVGAKLNYAVVGVGTLTSNSVNTYAITVPVGKTIQNVLAKSNACSSDCSNKAQINLAAPGTGILSIEPSYFNMTENYTTQTITLSNTGSGTVSNMIIPTIAEPFSIVSNKCDNSLAPNTSCTLNIIYTVGNNGGQSNFIVNYNNGSQDISTSATIPYFGKTNLPFAILTVTPSSFNLSESHPVQRITLQNTGTATATSLTKPTLTTPLVESATTCSSSLAINETCTYDVYANYAQTFRAGTQLVTFNYNNGQQSQSMSATANWTRTTLRWLLITAGGNNQPAESSNGYIYSTINTVNNLFYQDGTTGINWLYKDSQWIKLSLPDWSYPDTTIVDPLQFLANDSSTSYLWKCINGTCTQITSQATYLYSNSTVNQIYASQNISGNDYLAIYSSNLGSSWSNLTGGNGQPTSQLFGRFNDPTTTQNIVMISGDLHIWASTNNGISYIDASTYPNAPAMPVYMGYNIASGSSPNNIVINLGSDTSVGPLYKFNGSTWTLLTGGANQPDDANSAICNNVYGSNSILISTSAPDFWLYNGSAWTQITGGANQPASNAYCDGWVGLDLDNPPTNMSSLYYSSLERLWYYDGSSWITLNGGSNQPADAITTFTVKDANGNTTSLYSTDSSNNLWYYSGGTNGTWTQISGGANQPATVSAGYSQSASKIAVIDSNNMIWGYNNGVWTKYTNGGINQPATVSKIYSYVAEDDQLIVKDSDGNIWTYK